MSFFNIGLFGVVTDDSEGLEIADYIDDVVAIIEDYDEVETAENYDEEEINDYSDESEIIDTPDFDVDLNYHELIGKWEFVSGGESGILFHPYHIMFLGVIFRQRFFEIM